MNPIIENHVLPLVGSVHMGEFDQSQPWHTVTLQTKFCKHIRERNVLKLTLYLAFCIQEWPDIDACPLDRDMIKDAVKIIGG